jgi:hypothetical protein
MTKDAAQRSPSALLRAMSLSNGRWTFYEAVILWVKDSQLLDFFTILKVMVSREKE